MRIVVSLTLQQWNALALAAHKGIFVADLLGPDDPQFAISEQQTQDAHDALKIVEDHAKDQILKRARTAPVVLEPESFPSSQAYKEGWCFDLDENTDTWEIRRIVDGPDTIFTSDRHALAFVTGRAALDSSYHQQATDWLGKANALQSAAASIPPRARLEAAE